MVKAKVIGYMQMTDNGEGDEKIIAVDDGDMSVSHIHEIGDLPINFQQELKHFFLHYKNLLNKEVLVNEFDGRHDAISVIEKSLVNYSQKFKK